MNKESLTPTQIVAQVKTKLDDCFKNVQLFYDILDEFCLCKGGEETYIKFIAHERRVLEDAYKLQRALRIFKKIFKGDL